MAAYQSIISANVFNLKRNENSLTINPRDHINSFTFKLNLNQFIEMDACGIFILIIIDSTKLIKIDVFNIFIFCIYSNASKNHLIIIETKNKFTFWTRQSTLSSGTSYTLFELIVKMFRLSYSPVHFVAIIYR